MDVIRKIWMQWKSLSVALKAKQVWPLRHKYTQIFFIVRPAERAHHRYLTANFPSGPWLTWRGMKWFNSAALLDFPNIIGPNGSNCVITETLLRRVQNYLDFPPTASRRACALQTLVSWVANFRFSPLQPRIYFWNVMAPKGSNCDSKRHFLTHVSLRGKSVVVPTCIMSN